MNLPFLSPTLIADAIAELEAYDDEEHRAVLELVRELLDEQDDAHYPKRSSLVEVAGMPTATFAPGQLPPLRDRQIRLEALRRSSMWTVRALRHPPLIFQWDTEWQFCLTTRHVWQ